MLLGYKPRFVLALLQLTKLHTIRDERKVKPKIGELLHMYTGLRTSYCKHISSTHTLKGWQWIVLSIWCKNDNIKIRIWVDKRPLTYAEMEQLAINDGFDTLADLAGFFLNGKNRYKGKKQLFHWTNLKY